MSLLPAWCLASQLPVYSVDYGLFLGSHANLLYRAGRKSFPLSVSPIFHGILPPLSNPLLRPPKTKSSLLPLPSLPTPLVQPLRRPNMLILNRSNSPFLVPPLHYKLLLALDQYLDQLAKSLGLPILWASLRTSRLSQVLMVKDYLP